MFTYCVLLCLPKALQRRTSTESTTQFHGTHHVICGIICESNMADRESVMQVRCTGLLEQITGSAYSGLHKTRHCQLKPAEESGFYMQELGGGSLSLKSAAPT
ncbi:hypothetical protein NDU88_004976 [Pleurodeles waltl]|uniref:Secreted protein n=1 Tax=Pleurodeles waltl TaxID=8319 RepID=A0AAV7UKL2_PLEWA|nr:hypothetical protein NDU88_004976 [Pleurodeles waltl]